VPSKSFSQARMMAGAAHDPVFAKKVGVPPKVAKEFNKADDKSGFLGSAMRAKGPAFKEGGKVKKYAEGSQVTAEDEAEYRRSGQYLADKMRLEAMANQAKMDKMMKDIHERRRTAPPARSDKNNPDAATITKRPSYAKGGGVKGKGCETRGTRPAKYY
jgi:hypothetical protein